MTKSDLYYNRIRMLNSRLLHGLGSERVLRAEIAKAYSAWDVYSAELLARAERVLAEARAVRS